MLRSAQPNPRRRDVPATLASPSIASPRRTLHRVRSVRKKACRLRRIAERQQGRLPLRVGEFDIVEAEMRSGASNQISRLAGGSGVAGAPLFFAGRMLFYGHLGPGAE